MMDRIRYVLLVLVGSTQLPAQNTGESAPPDRTDPPSEKTYERRIYFKLPLAQPRFHWYFEEGEKLLNGELTLTIQQPGKEPLSYSIFDDGNLSEEWATRTEERGFYFLFQSRNPIRISRNDHAEITLRVREDLKGIGADAKGILRKGTYTSEGTFTIYDDSDSDLAFLSKQNWNPHWNLELTSNKGWMEKIYEEKKRPLGPGNDYLLSFSYSEDGSRSISVVDHESKEYFMESFRDQEAFLEYIVANRENLPSHVLCSGSGPGFLPFCEELQRKLKNVQLTYFTEAGLVGSQEEFMENMKAAKYFSIYREREK